MNPVICFAGWGYLAQKTAALFSRLNQPHRLCSFSKGHYPQAHHISLNLDDEKPFANPPPALFKSAALFYSIPPNQSGRTDQRAGRLIDFLHTQAAQQSRPASIVLISTTGVYGDCDGNWIDENQPLNPGNDRAYRRVSSEQQFSAFCQLHHIPLTILRVAGFYAADKLPLARIKKQLPLVNASESPFSNRIHADDLAEICKQALLQNHPGIYNCSDGHPSTMLDYFSRIARAFSLPSPPVISMQEAQIKLSPGMLSYMQENRRIKNDKLLSTFSIKLQYPSLDDFILSLDHTNTL